MHSYSALLPQMLRSRNVSKVLYIIHVKKNVKRVIFAGTYVRINAVSNVEFVNKCVYINVVRGNVTESVANHVMNA